MEKKNSNFNFFLGSYFEIKMDDKFFSVKKYSRLCGESPLYVFLLFLTNYNLLFTITLNNFSDSDDNKIKFKKKLKRMQFRVDVH